MKKKIIIVLVVLLAGGGFVAKSMFLKPAVAKEKIEGTIYILPKQFTANLKDGRYATLTVALVLAPGQSTGAVAGGEGATPPEGFGTLPEETQGFLQFQWQKCGFGRWIGQPHRAALLDHGVAEADFPVTNRLDQALEDVRGRDRIR